MTWELLNHENILSTVEATLGERLSNLILPRNSYINRVYELEKYDSRERFIVKFYRPGRWTLEQIQEEHDFLFELSAQEIPVVPPIKIKNKTLFLLPTPTPPLQPIPYTLFPKRSGRALDEFDKNAWEELGRLIARMHLVGETRKASGRVFWRPAIATKHHLETILKTSFLLPKFDAAFKQATEAFIKKADPSFENQNNILLHGDCHKGNLIHRPNEGIFIIDFDDICFGPAVQDLWLLLPDVPDNCQKELSWFIKGYETFRPFPATSLSLIPFLRGMRLIHFAAWLAVQCHEPDFFIHFPEAKSARYQNELIKELQEISVTV
ncbi:MAG: serine/threonine protein kinase [bacterium]